MQTSTRQADRARLQNPPGVEFGQRQGALRAGLLELPSGHAQGARGWTPGGGAFTGGQNLPGLRRA